MLYQNGQEALRIELSNPRGLCDLLSGFYAHTQPDIQGFEQAVQEFKDRVPDLAGGLNEKIKDAHKKNKKFQAAFHEFSHASLPAVRSTRTSAQTRWMRCWLRPWGCRSRLETEPLSRPGLSHPHHRLVSDPQRPEREAEGVLGRDTWEQPSKVSGPPWPRLWLNPSAAANTWDSKWTKTNARN